MTKQIRFFLYVGFAVVGMFVGPAVADPACEAGLVGEWYVNTDTSANQYTGFGCTTGSTFSSVAEARSTCIPSHGTPHISDRHWAGTDTSSAYDGIVTSASVTTQSHLPNHNVWVSVSVQILHRCVDGPPVDCPADGTPVNRFIGGLCIGSGCQSDDEICMIPDEGPSCAGRPVRTVDASGATVVSGQYEYTGEACVDTPYNEQPTPPGLPDGCVISASGNAVCLSEENCGTVNGERFCTSDIPPATNCATNSSGGRVCLGDAPRVELPDSGDGQTPAEPDAVFTDHTDPGTPGTVNYYSSNTVNGSVNQGSGGDPDATGNCGAPGQPSCVQRGACGGPGQPACRVEIVGDTVGLAKEEGTGGGGGGDGGGAAGTISGGGGCGAAPTCSNDPIQCYHARELWELRCSLSAPTSDDAQGAASAGLADGLGESEGNPFRIPQHGEEIDLSTWFTAPVASTAECPADIDISVLDATITIPLSQICEALRIAGIFVLLGATFLSLRVFTQGFH